MATRHKNLSFYREEQIPSGEEMRIGIIVSEWNNDITDVLLNSCVETLTQNKTLPENIFTIHVPGSFELPSAAQMLMEGMELDAVICLGCIIKGETQHDQYIANAVAQGLMMISVDYSTPVIFGVLTTDNLLQAQERAGGKHGNKGTESAITALKMAALRRKLI
ncbi:MAG: 6,7-dimethyl-8-ribityllumazine synthase [Bacteroidetes bacterium]|nr:6,7-dimethyl-8-ribityllumazine synthase [Bacteroidota bacterium]MBK7109655.1 6,7-dimethyl-8-ribityllumazine synthase [Bacteroidota bacterium]MBK8487616.1 6,7-dimethyl-8-ribityllumazine synthase [Bacteroidota bacterium]MBP9549987.1 6,7-dimethyl-8-ribityllumazine synthase [Chitinophagales bacterium]